MGGGAGDGGDGGSIEGLRQSATGGGQEIEVVPARHQLRRDDEVAAWTVLSDQRERGGDVAVDVTGGCLHLQSGDAQRAHGPVPRQPFVAPANSPRT